MIHTRTSANQQPSDHSPLLTNRVALRFADRGNNLDALAYIFPHMKVQSLKGHERLISHGNVAILDGLSQ